jgi:MYXO-CTERM domain-containing protein
MWVSPMDAGYSLACNTGQFDALGGNPEANAVNQINLLIFLLPDGGTTWPIANATASNEQVCWEAIPTDMMSVTVPVMEDVATGPSWPDAVFPDVTDLAVEADGTLAYLKFDVPAIDGKITKTRLFMRSSTAPSSDGDGGEVHAVTDSTWSESTMTFNTRPQYDAFSLGRIGPASADVLVSLELSTPLEDSGLHSFAVFSPPTDGNGTHFWSKEGAPDQAAYLKIDYMVVDADGDGANDGPDCDDADPNVNPSAPETCNGIDDDCDDDVDEGCGDADGSGSGDAGGTDGGTEGGDTDGATATAGQDDGPALPPGGRGADTGCGCTSSDPRTPFALVVLAFAFTRRRRAR